MKPHKHADLIKAWADGAVIQVLNYEGIWKDTLENSPKWADNLKYRIKPSPKEVDVYFYEHLDGNVFVDTHLNNMSIAYKIYKKTITLTEDDKI